ncbi:Rrf2 family transcriptional regulator [Streptococcus gallolyticus]|uniref:Rrf2 family transcriptional regulator n=1 Tax=Streptococcus gallolyticus TaxID=315405 RepID=UPI002284EAEB|nr:Rrf2 family transcriptional regulator [Streptococcus gallolyticus]MCY7187030.1 Rrf2 family transcriptional regulator [Streptococcus gallolyticus subsp. gallolyticus]
MKQSAQLSDAIHILIYLAFVQDPNELSSEAIALSINTNASRVRKLMSYLKKANLIESNRGRSVTKIAKPLSEISILDVYRSLNESAYLLGIDQNTSQLCPVGESIQEVLNIEYQKIQKAAEREMAAISLKDVMDNFVRVSYEKHPDQKEWYEEFF